jgi:serine/threonine protein kinase
MINKVTAVQKQMENQK